MGFLDFLKKNQGAMMNGFANGMANAQQGDDFGTSLGKAIGGMATNRIASAFQGDAPQQEVVPMKEPTVDTGFTPRPTMELPPNPSATAEQPLNMMMPEQQPQPIWQSKLMERATPSLPNTNIMLPRTVDTEKKNSNSAVDANADELYQAMNAPTDNQDKGFRGWLKEFAQNVGSGMQDAQRNNPNGGFLENLGSALGTGIAGGTAVRNLNEERQKQYKIQKTLQKYGINQQIENDRLGREYRNAQITELVRKPEKEAADWQQRINIEQQKNRAKVESATTAFKNRMEILDKQQKFAGGQWQRYIDENGKVFKQYKDGRFEPVIGLNGEQDTDPSKLTYDVYDPITGNNVKATGGQILGYSGNIQAGNAQREQQANIQNAQFDLEAQKTNARAVSDFNGQILQNATRIAQQSGRANEDFAEMNGLNVELQAANEELTKINPDADPDRYNQLVDKINNLAGKVEVAAGKTISGAQALQEMKQMGINRPTMVKAPKVTPVRVGGSTGKPAPKGKDPYGYFQ